MPSVATGALLANKTDAGHRRQRRRRHRRDRHRPVRAPDAAQPAAGLHHRGQRLLRPDQGPVLADRRPRLDAQERRRQRPAADRHAARMAIELGATFVARSFSGDKKQLSALLKAALSHKGTAMLDVLRPCVTFNDHEGSTKSYSYVKDHEEPLSDVSFVPFFEDIADRARGGHDARSGAARRLADRPEEARSRLRPDRQGRARCRCCTRPRARRVRDRPALHRPDKAGLLLAAQPGGRAAGVAAGGAHAPVARRARQLMERQR